ncbi:response regulator, partial [candidate division KSB1 bacterium]
CTGGGGAMSMSEYTPRRLKSAKIKADQLTATGAKFVVTSCHNCVDGLADLIKHYKLDMKVIQLVNLVADALILEKKVAPPVEEVAVEEKIPVEEVPVTGDKPLEGFTILVTDDEPDMVTFLSVVLEDNGAKVLKAFNGDEAIEIAQKEEIDLMTLDINMPGKSGKEVFEAFRSDDRLKSVPICIITGRPELRGLIYDRPFPAPEGYMDKPVSEDSLLLNMRKILKVPHK